MTNWHELRNKNIKLNNDRNKLYKAFLFTTLVIILIALFLWMNPPPERGNKDLWLQASYLNSTLGHTADILRYVLPDIFEGFITLVVIHKPRWFMVVLVIIAFFIIYRNILTDSQRKTSMGLRSFITEDWPADQDINQQK
jgi:hypothetical protein